MNNDVEEWTRIVKGSVSDEHPLLLSSEKCLKTLAISRLVKFEIILEMMGQQLSPNSQCALQHHVGIENQPALESIA